MDRRVIGASKLDKKNLCTSCKPTQIYFQNFQSANSIVVNVTHQRMLTGGRWQLYKVSTQTTELDVCHTLDYWGHQTVLLDIAGTTELHLGYQP